MPTSPANHSSPPWSLTALAVALVAAGLSVATIGAANIPPPHTTGVMLSRSIHAFGMADPIEDVLTDTRMSNTADSHPLAMYATLIGGCTTLVGTLVLLVRFTASGIAVAGDAGVKLMAEAARMAQMRYEAKHELKSMREKIATVTTTLEHLLRDAIEENSITEATLAGARDFNSELIATLDEIQRRGDIGAVSDGMNLDLAHERLRKLEAATAEMTARKAAKLQAYSQQVAGIKPIGDPDV
jgi:hypothetical protein